ncbi:hypothetical protein [Salinisphaera sp. Q1T1-3]|uniref:hypothetical protein n=1 Tax=Salinisphaera sp. Q1T1-3 TaxID=2321229 RepID=UPI000E74295F|nr:hypothetical protein [Salinisphaera sp. Q1T1-3]RJS92030.1 hypothetical protein D3260_12850 [Salinisphaera sp. Q1T1-3]
MHLLAQDYRDEFLATPQLIRFEHADGADNKQATLLLKASTLTLKLVVLHASLELILTLIEDNRFLYALKIKDDDQHPCVVWSILENEREKAALLQLTRTGEFPVFLFNELAVNVAWANGQVVPNDGAERLTELATLSDVDYESIKPAAVEFLNHFDSKSASDPNTFVLELCIASEWQAVYSTYVTSRSFASPVGLFHADEGGQQEQIAIWLTDNLDPFHVILSPQIPKDGGTRELTDVLLSYAYGSILIESKALTIFGRSALPSRTKLAKDVSKHLKKATSQLKGAIRSLRGNVLITDSEGVELEVQREAPAHAIALVPELDLIQDQEAFGGEFIRNFMAETGGFVHILDIGELLRIVQAAEMIAERSETITPLMAFDYYLVERAKKTLETGTLCIEVLLRFQEE